jgi:RES domain-containing protein
MAPKWSHSPNSTTGAAYHGGRWNRPGAGALYLSEVFSAELPVATAWAEYQQDIGTRIGTLVPYAVDLDRVVDLTDHATTSALKLNVFDFHCAWKDITASGGVPPTWRIADLMISENVHAIRVPSAAHPGGVNIVVYKLAGTPGQKVQAIDPSSMLPVNLASWSSTRGP